MSQNSYIKYIIDAKKNWHEYITNWQEVNKQLSATTFIFIGVIAYTRSILGLILKNSLVFCVRKSKEIDLMRQYTNVVCIEEKHPKLISKIRSTGYLLKNFVFTGYIKKVFLEKQKKFSLLLYSTTPHIYRTLQDLGFPYIGNNLEAVEYALLKSNFRDTLKNLGLPHLPSATIDRKEFALMPYEKLYSLWNSPFVCQRGDHDKGGEEATFFIKSEDDLKRTQQIFANDERFNLVEVTKFITGNTYSMIGCATKHGIFTGNLQLQLIDIKESFFNSKGSGTFVGHDFTPVHFSEKQFTEATSAVKAYGKHLFEKGYKGVFGIDLIADAATGNIYPLECNPRFTGAFPMLPILQTMAGVPSMELIHIIEHQNIAAEYNFEKLDTAYKNKLSFSHVFISVSNIETMPLDLPMGIYRIEKEGEFVFDRPALFPWEIKSKDEFLVIDTILPQGALIGQEVVKLFKLVFSDSIAKTSYALKPEYAIIVQAFSELLYDSNKQRWT